MKYKSGLSNFYIISLFIVVLLVAISSPLEAQMLSAKKKATALAASMQPAQNTQPVQATQAVQAAQPVQTRQPVQATTADKAKSSRKLISGKNADYWFDKGALCAAYGNDRAAIKYFQKTIALDPNRSGAYFEQGISYGQLGVFDKTDCISTAAAESICWPAKKRKPCRISTRLLIWIMRMPKIIWIGSPGTKNRT